MGQLLHTRGADQLSAMGLADNWCSCFGLAPSAGAADIQAAPSHLHQGMPRMLAHADLQLHTLCVVGPMQIAEGGAARLEVPSSLFPCSGSFGPADCTFELFMIWD